ncbi:MAG: hypothetical protein RRA92_11305, partial [Gemmatimonadota bacterium]|nr:hypothetical protein [Gemmatimonadota bacterium]
GPFSFEVNFRPAGPGLVQTSWSLVGLPFPVDASGGNVVTFEVKAPGDAFPPASRENTTSSDFAIPFPGTCRDTNDGRWAI